MVNIYIEKSCAINATNSECNIGGRSIAETYGWCVSRVTDMSFLFQAKNEFNEDLSETGKSHQSPTWV